MSWLADHACLVESPHVDLLVQVDPSSLGSVEYLLDGNVLQHMLQSSHRDLRQPLVERVLATLEPWVFSGPPRPLAFHTEA